ncbi:MAG: hypothetical protein HKM98_11280 [Gammaproteobacteria bacterium]|nr:hypothetical protein [Gammaproteobacteria bacterium]
MSEISRLRWLCRRGMKELDVVMSRYLEEHYESATTTDQDIFKALLEKPDPDLYELLLGRGEQNDPELVRFLEFLRHMSGQD